MRLRLVIPAAALAAAAAAASMSPPPPRPAPPRSGGPEIEIQAAQAGSLFIEGAQVTGAVSLTSSDERFGGLSGLTINRDGLEALTVSDRGGLYRLTLAREGGALRGVARATRLARRDLDGDAEDLAALPDGGLAISYEGVPPRVRMIKSSTARSQTLRLPPALRNLQRNSGLEALAADAKGALYAIPERSGALDRPFPVWRRDKRGWSQARWPRAEDYLVTGADIGPDGRLYVTERAFTMLGGFRWRLQSADLADWPDLTPRLEARQAQGGFDNIEGVAVWRAPDGGIRALLVADDNFVALQRTLLIELALSGG